MYECVRTLCDVRMALMVSGSVYTCIRLVMIFFCFFALVVYSLHLMYLQYTPPES